MNSWLMAVAGVFALVIAAGGTEPAAPPPALVEQWKLAPFYTKHASVEGLPVLGSAKVSDFAIVEAAFLIRQMAGHRPEILCAMATNRVRFVIMAPTEMTTDIPEHSDLQPRTYWNRRARGLGATRQRPAVSCGEENLLDLPGDPYAKENILIHEFAHAIHEMGLNVVTPDFDARLKAAYERARAKGLWRGTYAMQNRSEDWAEAAQSWFDCNRANDTEHGPIDTREKLKDYDPDVAKLCAEVFGDTPWRYTKPSKRPAAERKHLAGFDVAKSERFAWPKTAPELDSQGEPLTWLELARTPSATPRGGRTPTTINFVNRRAQPVSVEWLDFDGQSKHMADIRPGLTHLQNTYAGHVWVVAENGKRVGTVIATGTPGRVEIQPAAPRVAASDSAARPAARFDPVVREIEGWKVHVEPALLEGEQRDAGAQALAMLANHLQRIRILVPAGPLAKLQQIELWIERAHPTLKAKQYHPSRTWLVANGHDPRLARKVHIPQAASLLSREQMLKHPAVILHELAHAYHDQILGFDHRGIIAAFDQAVTAGRYESVLLYTGKRVRHYALNNAKEYFAEGTEAYFYRNDFYPFVRAELHEHDPGLHAELEKIWGPAR